MSAINPPSEDFFKEMVTVYYCKKCDSFFSEEKIPNINKIHRECGDSARVVRHYAKHEKDEH